METLFVKIVGIWPQIQAMAKNATSFRPGQSGNPGGKPIHARAALSDAFIKAVAKDFRENGAKVLEALRTDKPDKYCELIASIIPKETNVSVEQSGTVTHEHVAVSEVAGRIAERLGTRAESASETSLPN